MIATPRLPDPNDTIVALSSAAGAAARAIVRLSGRRAIEVVRSVYPDFDRAILSGGRFLTAPLQVSGFAATIDADVYLFKAPHSYTGEDVIEIHTIGCQPIVDALIADCLNAGARSAQPGEFTMRAFLASKLDLTRAEAVLGVIEATGRADLIRALAQLAGGLAQPLQALRDDVLNLLADVEAGLDFADEDIHFVAADDLLKRIARGLAQLTLLRRQLDQRSLKQDHFRVVLAGAPNAGKSSLFNALIGADAAIVSSEPGTTRDWLEKTIEIDGVRISLVDTAGLGESVDAIERSAQELGQVERQRADLVLWCIPSGEPKNTPTGGPQVIMVATKADLATAESREIATSAVTGAGISELKAALANRARAAQTSAMTPSVSRCRHHLDACLEHLRHAHAMVIDEQMPEFLALQLRLALEELGAMTGTIYTDDLLDRIFSRFCIGK